MQVNVFLEVSDQDPMHKSHLRPAYNSALQNCGTDNWVLLHMLLAMQLERQLMH